MSIMFFLFSMVLVMIFFVLIILILKQKILIRRGCLLVAVSNLIIFSYASLVFERLDYEHCLDDLLYVFIVMLVINGILFMSFILLLINKFRKCRNESSYFLLDDLKAWGLIGASVVVWIIGIVPYQMFHVNNVMYIVTRLEKVSLTGMPDSDPIIMLGYCIQDIFGISSINVICRVVPVLFYSVFVLLMWNTGKVLFSSNNKKCYCFNLIAAIIVVLSDSRYYMSNIIMHGLVTMENVWSVICISLLFLYGCEACIKQAMGTIGITCYFNSIIVVVICLCTSFLFSKVTFVISSISLVSFTVIILVIGGYKKWILSRS